MEIRVFLECFELILLAEKVHSRVFTSLSNPHIKSQVARINNITEIAILRSFKTPAPPWGLLH